MRYRAKIDANQPTIVKALRDAGYSVVSMAPLGCGVPDILVGGLKDGRQCNWILEIKDGSKPPSQRKLTDDEIAFSIAWRGQYAVVETPEEAIEACK